MADDLSLENSRIRGLHIKKSRCNRYVPNEQQICGCGLAKQDHSTEALHRFETEPPLGPNEKWTPNAVFTAEDFETDAFGEIRFDNNEDLDSKFIRVGQFTPMEKMVSLLFNCWRLQRPKLVISVTGGAMNFFMKPKLRDVFRKGIVKAALSTNAWITTGGTNAGVMKHVGEAIKKFSIDPNNRIVLLGIANWCTIADNHLLIKKNMAKGEKFAYRSDTPNIKRKQTPLDPNHSHFVLVDNSELNKFGGEIEFRGKLERAIVNFKNDSSSEDTGVPIVVLVLEGGPGTFKTVLNSVKNGSPCVFVEGSGRCADLFAYVLSKLANDTEILKPMDHDLREEIMEKMEEYGGEKTMRLLEETLQYPHLLTVFRLESSKQVNDIDIAVLLALLKAKKNNYKAQLKLSLTWNRIDIAREYILTEDRVWQDGELDDLLFSAILLNRVEFVDSFLQSKCDINRFLTYRRLLKLYNSTPDSSFFYTKLMNHKRNKRKTVNHSVFKFKEIGDVIEELLDGLFEYRFSKRPVSLIDSETTRRILEETDACGNLVASKAPVKCIELDFDSICEHPINEIFIYSVLLGKTEMAKIFWSYGNNEISSALVASRILKSYGSEFLEASLDFENQATNILQLGFERNPVDSELLLIRQIPEYDNTTPLQIAALSEQKNFVSNPCYQKLLAKLWYGQIFVGTPLSAVLLSTLFPFAAPIILNLEDDKHKVNLELTAKKLQNVSKASSKKTVTPENEIELNPIVPAKSQANESIKLSYLQELVYFFKSPYIKFIYNQLTFFVFLLMFSYLMLCQFYPIRQENEQGVTIGKDVSVLEIVIMVWIAAFSMDEILKFVLYERKKSFRQILKYLKDSWNLIHITSIVLFVTAMGLRFTPGYSYYLAARIILSIDIIFWFFRGLHGYSYIRSLGPKLVMIRRMIGQLAYFTLIAVIFIFSYGVSTQSLMYHNQEFNLGLIKNIFFPAYFVIGGEYYQRDDLMDIDDCQSRNDSNYLITDEYSQDDCPEVNGAKVSLGLLAINVLMLNVLLVNLLIAIFSNTYTEVEAEADQIWKLQRYGLCYEYFNKPFLATPFSLLYYFYEFVRILVDIIIGYFTKKSLVHQTSFYSLFMTNSEKRRLKSWENFISEEYLSKITADDSFLESKIQSVIGKVESLAYIIEELRQEQMDIKQSLTTKAAGSKHS